MLQEYVSTVSSIFQMYVASVCYLNVAYVFTHMLQIFYLDVVYICNVFQMFLQVFQTHVSSVLSDFFLILQVLHLKVDRVLQIEYAWEAGGGASGHRRRVAWATFGRRGPRTRRKREQATFGRHKPMHG
jgi:hypothetical protein